MASLLNLQTGEEVFLLAQHIVGRHPTSSNTVLSHPDASRTHATISWNGEYWLLQDNSTNGTYINGSHISRGTSLHLNPGDKVNFANIDADTWAMKDAEAPKSVLIPEMEDSPLIILENIAVLPSEECPEVTLYLSPQGHWVCENQSGYCCELTTGDRVGTSESSWRFVEAEACAETLRIAAQSITTSSEVEVHFEVSQNEEHVALRFKMDDEEYDLGERNHHYLMLLLARQRIADKTAGFTEAEQGWVEKEKLSKMLRLSETHINIQVYRFRKQIVKALPQTLILPQVIERRTGEIRFVYDNVHITGGMQNHSVVDNPNQIAL